MTGLDRLREFAAGISPITAVCGVTKTAYDMEHVEVVGARLRDFLADIADQIEAEQDERVTRRVEDREAAEWVREHGGLEHLESSLSALELLAEGIEIDMGLVFYDETPKERCVAPRNEVKSRLVPEGYEWPRFVDGEPVRVGDKFPERIYGHECTATAIGFNRTAAYILGDLNEDWVADHGTHERVKRPAPKVLDADGVEIRVGDEVWDKSSGDRLTAGAIEDGGHTIMCQYADIGGSAIPTHGSWSPSDLTHRAPVLAADGEPLEVGQTVWHRGGNAHGVVEGIDAGSLMHTVRYRSDDGEEYRDAAKDLTHQRPVLDADGVPIHEGETVWGIDCGTYRITSVHDGEVFARHIGGPFGAEVESAGGSGLYRLRADKLTHEQPDSWERWREEWQWPPVKYCKLILGVEYDHDTQLQESFDAQGDDLVRRAKKLAGVSE